MPLEVIGGRHTGFPVIKLEEMKDFYTRVLGFQVKSEEIEEGPFISTIVDVPNVKIHVVKLTAPDGWMIELLHYLNIPPHALQTLKEKKVSEFGNKHIALTVKDAEKAYQTFCDLDLMCLSKPQISPSGIAKVFFGRDPEGNCIELVEILKK